MNELKPCPFCGSKDIYITSSWPHYTYCLDCGARTNISTKYGDEAINDSREKWNRRVNETKEA